MRYHRRMRVLLINRFWGDERVPSGRMLMDVAGRLKDGGHEVVVLTSADSYVETGTRAADRGFEVVRVRGFGPRLARWALFWTAACAAAPFLRWDRCLVLTDPPLMNWLAILDRLLRGGRRERFWWVLDLYPDAASACGLIGAGGVVERALRRVNDWSLRSLSGVIVLDEAQRARLQSYGNWRPDPDFSLVVPPWDHRPLTPPARRNRFVAGCGLEDRKIILYAGNLGRAHVFSPLLDAARAAAAREPDWTFVFVCRGHKRPELERAAAGAPNVRVLDYVPAEAAADMLFAAHVHAITLAESWTGVSVPSKLYGALQTGRPVLFLGSPLCGTAQEIVARDAGRVLPTTAAPDEVVAALRDLVARRTAGGAPSTGDGPSRIARFITRRRP